MEVKTKLVLKDAGDPKKARANMPDNVNRVKLGTVFGIAEDISERTGPDGTTKFRGLAGSFAIISAETEEETRSGLLYLPTEVQALIENQLFGEKEKDGVKSVERIATNVKFAFDINVDRATNPQGYSWSFTPKVQPAAETDPLAQFRNEIAQLPAPDAAKKLEAPKGEKAKEKA